MGLCSCIFSYYQQWLLMNIFTAETQEIPHPIRVPVLKFDRCNTFFATKKKAPFSEVIVTSCFAKTTPCFYFRVDQHCDQVIEW